MAVQLRPQTNARSWNPVQMARQIMPNVMGQSGKCDWSQRFNTIQAKATALDAGLSANLARAATESRGLAMDGVAKANSGHLGLPLGTAEIGAVLFGSKMSYNADDPQWINRDR